MKSPDPIQVGEPTMYSFRAELLITTSHVYYSGRLEKLPFFGFLPWIGKMYSIFGRDTFTLRVVVKYLVEDAIRSCGVVPT